MLREVFDNLILQWRKDVYSGGQFYWKQKLFCQGSNNMLITVHTLNDVFKS